jgi:peptidoglycan/LPS O-acetylase OafA/YrhL
MGPLRAIHDFQDVWRIACALTVVASHAVALHLFAGNEDAIGRIAHLAVVVFFVISGFSVASAAPRYPNPMIFLAARWSRLWSVAIPMVLLALVIDLMVGGATRPNYPTWQYSKWYAHLLVNLAFVGEFWAATYRPFTIIPYWSLAYEFWYYCLFAIWFLPRSRFRWLLIATVILIMGPRVWLLLPCWLLGVWVYRRVSIDSVGVAQTGLKVGPLKASLIFIVCVALLVATGLDATLAKPTLSACESVERIGLPFKCGYSRWFLADYLVAILFAFVLLSLRRDRVWGENPLTKLIRWFAPLTFGIYLGHYTLIMAAVTFVGDWPPIWLAVLTLFAVVAAATALGLLFERTRPLIRHWLERLLTRAGAKGLSSQ